MECPRCVKELGEQYEMVIEGAYFRCRMCGKKIPRTEPVEPSQKPPDGREAS